MSKIRECLHTGGTPGFKRGVNFYSTARSKQTK